MLILATEELDRRLTWIKESPVLFSRCHRRLKQNYPFNYYHIQRTRSKSGVLSLFPLVTHKRNTLVNKQIHPRCDSSSSASRIGNANSRNTCTGTRVMHPTNTASRSLYLSSPSGTIGEIFLDYELYGSYARQMFGRGTHARRNIKVRGYCKPYRRWFCRILRGCCLLKIPVVKEFNTLF